MGSHQSDEEIMLWTQAGEKLRGKFVVVQQRAENKGSGYVLKALEIVCDGGVSLLHGG